MIHAVCTQVPRMNSAPTEKYTSRITQTTPAFAMIADRRAEAGAGAIGWAVGSHPCIGYIPALVPNPTIPANTAARRMPSCPATFAESRNPPYVNDASPDA